MAIFSRPSNLQLDIWLKAIARGDRDALASLYNATSSGIYAYILSIVQSPHDAQDLLHDCYITIWNTADSYRSKNKPMAWIITLARNLCYKRINKRNLFQPLEDAYLESIMDSQSEDALMLRNCMLILSGEERQIVLLHVIAGCSHREIAQMLCLKASTVMSKYHRALKKLRDSF